MCFTGQIIPHADGVKNKRNEKNLYVLVVGAISVMNLHDVYLLYEQKYQVDNRNVHE